MKNATRTYIIIGILTVLAIVGWLYVARLVMDKYESIQARGVELAQNEQIIRDARAVRLYSTERRELLSAIQNRFVDAQTVVRFIEELETIANTAGVTIELGNVSMSAGDRKPSFNFSVNGTFRNVFHYITLLEHVPYEIDIAVVNMSRGDSAWQATIRVDLKSFTE